MKKGLVRGTDSDGDPVIYGWGFSLFLRQVQYTHESALNTTCSLYETKAEARKALAQIYDREIKKAALVAKQLRVAAAKLKKGRKAVLSGRQSPISPHLAIYSATNGEVL